MIKLLPLLYFILFTASLCFAFKRSFAKLIPLSFVLTTLIMFISQFLFKTFTVGFIINIIFCFIFLPFLIIKRENLKEFKTNFFSIGLLAFIIIYLFFFVFDYSRGFCVWDEFSHWGLMVKEMFRLDNFYSVASSTLLVHKDYPPMLQIFELFNIKIIGHYDESMLKIILHVFEFSMFIPALDSLSKADKKYKKVFGIISILVISFLMVLLFDEHRVINSIYTDYPLSLFTAYVFFYILIERKDLLSIKNNIILMLYLSFLILVKQMSLAFYAIIIFYYLLNCIIYRKNKKINIKKIVICILCLVIIPFFHYKLWSNYIQNLNVISQFETRDVRILETLNVLTSNKGENYQIETAHNYINSIINDGFSTGIINFNIIQLFIIISFIIYLFHYFNKTKTSKKDAIVLWITITIGLVGYLYLLLCLYVWSFGPVEGPNLASIERYIGAFFMIPFALFIMIFYSLMNKNKKSIVIKMFGLLVVALAITNINQFKYLIPSIVASENNTYEQEAKRINKVIEKKNVDILTVSNDLKYNYYVNYYLAPNSMNNYLFNSNEYYSNKMDIKQYYETKIKKEMINYDYLYLYNVDDDYIENYEIIFNNIDLDDGKIYKIIKDGNSIRLKLVN